MRMGQSLPMLRRNLSALFRAWPVLVALLVCVLACANVWLGPGMLNTRAGGDSPFLLQRVYELAANLRAGADLIVVGNMVEQDPGVIREMAGAVRDFQVVK